MMSSNTMKLFDIFETVFPFVFGGIFLIVILGMRFSFLTFLSPKFRGKLIARQVKGVKYATDYAKKDAKDVAENLRDVAIDTRKTIYSKHGQDLRDLNKQKAQMEADAISIKASALKDALLDDDTANIIGARMGGAGAAHTARRQTYCKHCGQKIDADSQFCKFCGKEQ